MPGRQAEYSGAAIHRSIQPRDGQGPVQVLLRARPVQQETAARANQAGKNGNKKKKNFSQPVSYR